jgi:MoxR-like ATPase
VGPWAGDRDRFVSPALQVHEEHAPIGREARARELIARRLTAAVADARLFQHLLTPFSTPEELFGPLSLSALRERDVYERRVEGFLPDAELAFLDEVFKAGSAILNTLLGVLNERQFVNGATVLHTPLLALVGASNEVPEEEGLRALYDRFALRLQVSPLQDEASARRLFREGRVSPTPRLPPGLALSAAELLAARARAEALPLSPALEELLVTLRRSLAARCREQGLGAYVSDRRWQRLAALCRASALLNGREVAELADAELLRHGLWDDPNDAPARAALLYDALAEPEIALLSVGEPAVVAQAAQADVLGWLDLHFGAPLPARYTASIEGHAPWTFSEDELIGALHGELSALCRVALLWDEPGQRLWRLRINAQGGLYTRWGQAIRQEDELRRFGARADTLQVERPEVSLRREEPPGLLLRFEALEDPARAEVVARLRGAVAALHSLCAALVAARLGPDGEMSPAARQAQRSGLARAELRARQDHDTLVEVIAAAQAGGRLVLPTHRSLSPRRIEEGPPALSLVRALAG